MDTKKYERVKRFMNQNWVKEINKKNEKILKNWRNDKDDESNISITR